MATTYNALVTLKELEGFFDLILAENRTTEKVDWVYDSELVCFTFRANSMLLSDIPEAQWKTVGLRSFLVSVDQYAQVTFTGNYQLAEYANLEIEHTSGFSISVDSLNLITGGPAAKIIKQLDDIADEAEVVECDSDKVYAKRYTTEATIREPRQISILPKLQELQDAFEQLNLQYSITCPSRSFDGDFEDTPYEIGPFAYVQVWTGPYSFVYLSESENGLNEVTPPPTPSPNYRRLTGQELLDKTEQFKSDSSKADMVRACGYVSITQSGRESLRFAEFYDALLKAKGVSLGDDRKSLDKGRPISKPFDFSIFALSDSELASCSELSQDLIGYEGLRPDGSGGLNFTSLYEALLEAKGIDTSGDISEDEADEDSPTKERLIMLPADWKNLDDSEIVERLESSTDVSAEVLTALAGSDDWKVRRAVAWHDNTPKAILSTLANDDDSDVRQALGERSLPREWRYLKEYEKISALQSDEIKADIIEVLSRSENWSLRQAVAWSPSTSDAVLSRLKKDDDEDVQFAASQERLLPVEWRFLSFTEKAKRLAEHSVDESILRVLAQSRYTDVRRAVALHEGTPQVLLDRLAEDDDVDVQSGIRERLLPDQWKTLDNDDRLAALREPGVPESVLEILAGSGARDIREAVASSPSAPDWVLERLAADEDSSVRSAVCERNLPEEWRILDEYEKVERLNAGPVDTNILEIFAKSGRWRIRQAVAQNNATAEATLQELLRDHDLDVQEAARTNLKERGAGDIIADSSIAGDGDYQES